jgi:hypothetical protein
MKVLFIIFLISSAYADIPVISFDGNDEKILGSISP